MIIGKSLTALGGGGLKPEIIVTAKAGALLNLHYKDSSIILQSYQLVAEETQHTFVVSVSETAYVVEDVTNGESVEVLVDAVSQYSVEIEYVTWLYKDGVDNTSLTGGWNIQTNAYYQSTYGGNNNSSFADDHLIVSLERTNSKAASYIGGFVTNNKISLANYTKLIVEFSVTSGNGTYYAIVGDTTTSVTNYGQYGYDGEIARLTNTTLVPEKTFKDVDISNVTTDGYFYAIGHVIGGYASIMFNIYKIGLQ